MSSSDFVLHHLQRNRLKQVQDHLNTLNSLCLVLGMDFRHIAGEIHSTLKETDGTRDISDHTLEKLAATIQSLREIKIQRMQRVSTSISYFLLSSRENFFPLLLDLPKPWDLTSFETSQVPCWRCGT